ncbi:MAG: LptF/LptG family permease [Myxococcales bacterium]|nr:LptF/LptG family permease [Myxococcales bacterium]
MLRRYVLRELLAPLAAWTAFLGFTFLMVAFLKGTDVLLGSAVGWNDLARMLGYLAPQLLVQALPVAFLLAMLLGLGRLAEDGELKAMQALGVPPARLFQPALALGVLLAGVQALLAFTAQPWGMAAASAEANEIIRRNLMHDIKPGVFHEEVKDFTFYAQAGAPDGGWRGVLLFDARDPGTPLLLLAESGQVKPAGATDDLAFELRRGSIHQSKPSTGEYSTLVFERAEILAGLSEARLLQNRFSNAFEEVTPLELRAMGVRAASEGREALPFFTALHWRLGQLLMPLAFALLGAPLAVLRRGGRTWGFVFTLASFAAYYALARSGAQAAVTGKVPPLLGGQLANLVFLAVGVALMWRISRKGAV